MLVGVLAAVIPVLLVDTFEEEHMADFVAGEEGNKKEAECLAVLNFYSQNSLEDNYIDLL